MWRSLKEAIEEFNHKDRADRRQWDTEFKQINAEVESNHGGRNSD